MADGIPRIVTRPEPGSPPLRQSHTPQTDMGSYNLGQSPISYPPNAEIQLSAVSAKTRFLPPITYWEKYSGPQGSGNHAEGVWRHLNFFLKLQISSAGSRYFNLYCFPLHPSSRPPEIIKFTWSILGGLAGIRVGIKSGEHYVDLRLRGEGKYTPESVNYPPSIQNHWTAIPESLRDAMRSAGGLINLRVVPENEADIPMLESFFSHATEVNRPPQHPKSRYSDLQVAKPRPARPQTNPHLDPLIYDPFPGIPISLGRTPLNLPEAKSKSSSPSEPSQALAAMELSDGGAKDRHENEDHPKTPSSDLDSKGSSSSAWSFLGKTRGQNLSASSSSSSSSPKSLMPVPVTLKNPPVVVRLERESESDVQIIETRRRKSKRLAGAGKGEGKSGEEMEVKEKRNKRRRDVAESSVMGEEGAHDRNEDGNEEAEAERKRKKKERKKKRRNKDPDNDGDIEMETDVQSVDAKSTKKKSKKSRRKPPLSNSESPVLMQSPPPKAKKKKGKEKNKEKQPESMSNDPPGKPSRSGSEVRKSTKRKHSDPDSGDNNDDNNDEVDERLSRRRERLKKRINEINMEKHELRVEEEELKAKLLRLDFTTRQLDTGAIRAHCVCSACKKYGHKKNSVICEMHPDAIRIAAWRGS